MKKTIAIVDTLWAGHHPTYFKLFCEIAIDQGHKVLALSPAVSEMAEWKNEKKLTSDQIEIFSCREIPPLSFPIHFVGSLLTTCKRWLNVKATLKDIKPDLVFFLWLDSYLNILLFPIIHKKIFSFAWSGIYFHPSYLRVKSVNKLRQKLREMTAKIFKSNDCTGVAVLDEGIDAALQRIVGDKKKVMVFPDVADNSAPDTNYSVVKEIKAKAKNRKIVLLAGGLAKRKGFLTLLDTALNSLTENLFFVFAGRLVRSTFSQEELGLIERLATDPPGNCLFFFSKIPKESQFNALIAISDIVFACYEGFYHSSNLLTKSAIFQKPIIVSNKYCMGERINKYGFGVTMEEGNTNSCVNAIKQIINDEFSIENSCFDAYTRQHSFTRLKGSLESLIQDR
jgi:glycosyltransferase involved in cell wall biosynthesis